MTTEELEYRLINWGRWARGARRPGMSSVVNALEGAAAGQPAADDSLEEVRSVAPPVDELDAVAVQSAWERLPMTPHKYLIAKLLIGYTYAYPGKDPTWMVLKVNKVRGVHRRETEALVGMARTMMKAILERH